jgi:uncharacterized protein DUF1259
VLTEAEVNPVMSALLENGLDATALHNHFFFDVPRVFYMHVHGHGKAADLATRVKPALALIGKTPPAASASRGRALEGKLETAALSTTIGHAGDQSGAVYKITVGRSNLKVQEMGGTINARWGSTHGGVLRAR